MKKWLHDWLNSSFGDELKMRILAHLEKYQKNETARLWACDMLTMPGMLGCDVTKVRQSMGSLVSCGYVCAMHHRASQFYILEEGRQLLKEYHRFCQKWLLSKMTWYFDGHLAWGWKVVQAFLIALSVIVAVFTRFDAARSAYGELRRLIIGFF